MGCGPLIPETVGAVCPLTSLLHGGARYGRVPASTKTIDCDRVPVFQITHCMPARCRVLSPPQGIVHVKDDHGGQYAHEIPGKRVFSCIGRWRQFCFSVRGLPTFRGSAKKKVNDYVTTLDASCFIGSVALV